MEEGISTDRGYSYKTLNYFQHKLRDDLIQKGKLLGEKLNIFYIDWEGRNHTLPISKIKNCKIFVDEIVSASNCKNHHYVFTNNFLSYIHDSNLDIKHSYFLYDYLKEITPKHKLSYSVRRIIGEKIKQIKKLLTIPEVFITHSSYSFTDDSVDSNIDKEIDEFRKYIQTHIKDNYINKRGYGINDWGGEWNSNNMNENMWKMFGISEVCILFEHSPTRDRISSSTFSSVGNNFITEKSISHILVGKPFIPFYKETIDFYNKWLTKYGKKVIEFPLEYDCILDKMDYIDKLTHDEHKWKEFVEKLKIYVNN